MFRRALALAGIPLWAVLVGLSAVKASANGVRVAIPVREVTLSDGARRYAVTVRINGRDVDAALDTGSNGLWRKAADGMEAIEPQRSFSFGSGTVLKARNAEAVVELGQIQGTLNYHLVEGATCEANRPACGAGRVPFNRFGIEGDGLPGEGFEALLGIGLVSDPANPLVRLGAHRWIVHLPRPGERVAGTLIINPRPDELAGFISLRSVPNRAEKDEVPVCLRDDEGAGLCAPAIFDSGTPGLVIVNANADFAIQEGIHMHMTLGSVSNKAVPSIAFSVNDRTQGSHFMSVSDRRVPSALIRAGILPYFAFDVLYDVDKSAIEVRPRPSYPGGPEVAISEILPK